MRINGDDLTGMVDDVTGISVKGWPNENKYKRGGPNKNEYARGGPNKNEYKRGGPNKNEYKRGRAMNEYAINGDNITEMSPWTES